MWFKINNRNQGYKKTSPKGDVNTTDFLEL